MEDIVRITELPGANPLAGIELIPVVQNGSTKIRSAQDIVSEAGLGDHIANIDPHPQYAFRVKNNLTATTNPTVNDDDTEGYEPTSRWVNTVTEEFFICVTNDTGAANWQTLTLTLDELGSAALADVGAGNGLDADLLDAQQGTFYLDFPNFTNIPDPTLTLTGDVSGSATFTNLGNASLNVTVADDSHNHIISNVDGLQTALNGKLELSGDQMTGTLRVTENTWSSTTLTANAICTNPAGANGFAFGNGTSVSTWFAFDGVVHRMIDCYNDGSRITLNADTDVSGIITGNGSGLSSVDAETLDSLNSTSFLRSDTTDTASGAITFTNVTSFSGTVQLADRIQHTGDSDTYMQFHNLNQWRVVAAGAERLEVNSSNVTVSNADLVIPDGTVGSNATRDVFISTAEPTAGDGNDGDVWYVYEA